jgi:hypothetical protein
MNRSAAITTADYRRAVAKIIRDLQAQHSLTDLDFAERIGCCKGTIRAARNEESELGGVFLGRIEAQFGVGSIDPYLLLAGARSSPIEASEEDPLPSTAAAVHRLAVAQSPASPGGNKITHRELLEILPEIDGAIKSLTALKVRAENIRDAA